MTTAVRKRESVIVRESLALLGAQYDLIIMRNQVGASERFDPRTNEVRHERYGLGVGSPDFVAILAPSGRWFCLEFKSETGRLTPEQERWHRIAREFGAFVATVGSAEQAMAALERAREGASE